MPMVHQSSNKYPLLHLQTLPPLLLLLPSPASPQIRRPLTSPSSPPLARLTSDAPTPHLPSSSWLAQATGGAPFHDSSEEAARGCRLEQVPRRAAALTMDPGARSTDPSCYHAWPRRAGRCCAWSSRCLFPLPCSPAGAPRRSRG